MHFGHANSLRQAKAMSDYLIVGVHTDEDIMKNKGPTVATQEERYKMVRACKWVDEVYEGAPYVTQLAMMDKENIDFVVHGNDITCDADGNDCYQEIKDAGRYRECQRTQGVSTTDLVGRMLLLTKTHFDRPQDGEAPSHIEDMYKHAQGAVKGSPYTGVTQFLQTSQKIVQFSSGTEPKPGDKVVYVSGTFDLFHAGHCDFLEAAKAKGDYLIVGLYTDLEVNAWKGSNWPIMNLHERTLSVLANRHVDNVVIGAPMELTPELLEHFHVDVVVHGERPVAKKDQGVDIFKVAREKGTVETVQSGSELHAEMVVERILKNKQMYEERNQKKIDKELRIMKAVEAGTIKMK
ncbi:ethanolamine-phosphate cytidylyltransferase [Sphaeroforma arctica JP610]|uniref:ethanolamine-phosphate cytidylyltransferase n=1 Tax=Sphaeroforma arctica JP610 TaxID=667725 RepID=A0A0L0GAP2_9EUKA|nr:ethanolamine-phosphate cytidylyltransferase [Sphaeroforma arctica JP610]KNC85328.1 ethanolamine-phosphate cytidylyltransferase [Sphaeroforma arctica JP610]|eukprot:XP_014159230.1 ethanolamine-phosphate cytidylyltransferase [Sphaeroforma arctica JP610]